VQSLQRLVKAQQSLTPAWEECNRYDLTAAPCVSDWLIVLIRPGALLLVISHRFARVLVLVLWVGVGRK
jgi:hypothetical protein